MSSFFTTPGSVKKRKRTERTASGSRPPSKKTRETYFKKGHAGDDDEDISSDSEREDAQKKIGSDDEEDGDEFKGETAPEKRLRLAQQYLDNLKQEVDNTGEYDAADIDRDIIAERLKESVAEEKGRIYRHLAEKISLETAIFAIFRSNTTSTTSIAVCSPHIYTVTKDRHLIKWKLPAFPSPPATSSFHPPQTPKHIRYARGGRKTDPDFAGHIDEILCVAASQDGKFVATGGRDNRLIIWNAEDLKILKIFKHHRAAVTGLVFRRGTNQLYSSSSDRTVKLWSLDELAYVETLFGHQDEVVGIAALAGERCVTVGARDRTARLWKIVDETQLVFRGGGGGASSNNEKKPKRTKDGLEKYEEGSIDCVAMIDEEHFVTGSDNGNISFWSIHKKKPLNIIHSAHGLQPPLPPGESSAEQNPDPNPPCPSQPRYITALAAIPYSDLVFSGSWDGHVRVWKVSEDKRKLERVGAVGISEEKEGTEEKIRGVVTGISVFERGDKGKESIVLTVGTGQESRLGRWLKVKGRNGGTVVVVERKKIEKKVAEEKDAE